MVDTTAELYLQNVRRRFDRLKRLGEGALAQVNDEQFFQALDAESNSIAIIVKHLAGNALSRWTDFLTSDGEKPDRHRDLEFVHQGEDRAALMQAWENGWSLFLSTLASLKPDDLGRQVTVRHELHTVLDAINRQLEHYAYHIGQIVFVAKHLKSAHWKSLSIPRGESEAFNAAMKTKHTN